MKTLIKDSEIAAKFEKEYPKILKEITFPESVRLHNIFKEMGLKCKPETSERIPTHNKYSGIYYEYLEWSKYYI